MGIRGEKRTGRHDIQLFPCPIYVVEMTRAAWPFRSGLTYRMILIT